MHFRRSSVSQSLVWDGHHRFEHWYRDNTSYFITARVRGPQNDFASDEAKAIFRDRYNHYTKEFGFTPWVTSLLDNHYHAEGYLKVGENPGKMIQWIQGSVAKLVNDILPVWIESPFWCDAGRQGYYDGCLRSEVQGRRTFWYVFMQSRRHGICQDPLGYPQTIVNVDLERAIKRALELKAFMTGVPYKRYGEGSR